MFKKISFAVVTALTLGLSGVQAGFFTTIRGQEEQSITRQAIKNVCNNTDRAKQAKRLQKIAKPSNQPVAQKDLSSYGWWVGPDFFEPEVTAPVAPQQEAPKPAAPATVHPDEQAYELAYAQAYEEKNNYATAQPKAILFSILASGYGLALANAFNDGQILSAATTAISSSEAGSAIADMASTAAPILGSAAAIGAPSLAMLYLVHKLVMWVGSKMMSEQVKALLNFPKVIKGLSYATSMALTVALAYYALPFVPAMLAQCNLSVESLFSMLPEAMQNVDFLKSVVSQLDSAAFTCPIDAPMCEIGGVEAVAATAKEAACGAIKYSWNRMFSAC